MMSNEIQIHHEMRQTSASPRTLWTKPSVEVVLLQSAESGGGKQHFDGHSAHFTKSKS